MVPFHGGRKIDFIGYRLSRNRDNFCVPVKKEASNCTTPARIFLLKAPLHTRQILEMSVSRSEHRKTPPYTLVATNRRRSNENFSPMLYGIGLISGARTLLFQSIRDFVCLSPVSL